jgi:hypothetical protein
MGHIDVRWLVRPCQTAASTGSLFTATGCGFRTSSNDHYMVVRGPAPDTTSLGYWVDPFPTGRDGCGNATVSWTGSGVPGDFDVYIVRVPRATPWQATGFEHRHGHDHRPIVSPKERTRGPASVVGLSI